MKNFVEEFKKFISRGNVLDMAIGVVIGGVLLAGLYTLFNTIVIPNLQTEIGNMFSYSGT